MNKNIMIIYLAIVVVILVAFILLQNYDLFSDAWLILLGIILGSIGIGIGIALIKIKK